MPDYDILIRGGRVIDPATGTDGALDVAVKGDRIAAVQAGIPPRQAAKVVDASGRLVTPGLIDLHAHVWWGGTDLSLMPDDIGGPFGVTTVVDTGSAGASTFLGFRRFIIEQAKTRVIPFLHISSIGLAGGGVGECRNIEHVDVQQCVRAVQAHRDLIGGIKVRANTVAVGANGITPVYLARDAADAVGLPLIVDLAYPPPSLEQILPVMRPGDIATHMYKGYHGGLVLHGGKVRPSAVEARARGILFDLGHGAGSFSFAVAEAAFAQGFQPDTISTDLHTGSLPVGDIDMPSCMSKMLLLGADLVEVIRKSTAASAKALRRESELGSLAAGRVADVTVLELREGEWTLTDRNRGTRLARQRFFAHFTVCRGVVTYEKSNEC